MSSVPRIPIRELSAELTPSRYTRITTVGDIANVLLMEWPLTDGEEYNKALRVCLDVLEDTDMEAEDARAAFVGAAREAGIVVLPDDRNDYYDRYRKGLF